jgi:proteasome assembly chaperone (PAC2) family protein
VDIIKVDRLPQLHDPVAVIAFSGWNDAASAATAAARFVAKRLGARKFATLDPEEFFDFKDRRPNVRISMRGDREIQWPVEEFHFARNPTGPHDVVVAVGIEPHLRWRTFADSHISLFRDLGITTVVSLGALMADVPHTRPARVTGSAQDPSVAERLNLSTSRYEGPTGIVGIMHDGLRRSGIPAASLWANVPHYVTTAQNPGATIALLKRLETILGTSFDVRELSTAHDRFVAEVNTALSGNPEVQAYVERLEAAMDAGGIPEPAGEELLGDIEAFLRGQRKDD